MRTMSDIILSAISGISLLLFITQFDDVKCHGGMVEPPMRSIAWRYGFDTPVNYDWMSLYCGGLHTFQRHGGKCGLCGDPYRGPYENDRGGVYDTGVIVRHYPVGLPEVEVKVELTAHHKGYFRFKLCPNNENALTTECLDRYPLKIREGRAQGDPYRYFPPENPKLSELHVELPAGITCDRCVLQWTYTAGNSAGQGRDGRSCLGCGIQETFVNCADISIGGTLDRIPVAKGNGSLPSAGSEVVLPERVDIVDIIRNTPQGRSLNEFIQDLRQPTRRQESPRDHGFNGDGLAPPSIATPIQSRWDFERNPGNTREADISRTGFRNTDQSSSLFDNRLSPQWNARLGIVHPNLPTDHAPLDSNFAHQGKMPHLGDNSIPNRPLDFSGITNPAILRALNHHFGQHSMGHVDNDQSHGLHRSRDRFNDPLEAPRPSVVTGSRANMGPTTRVTNNHVVTGEGHNEVQHSTLLGSLNPLIAEINTRNQALDSSSNSFKNDGHFAPSTVREKFQKGDINAVGTDIFGNPTRELFPDSSRRSVSVPSHWQTRQPQHENRPGRGLPSRPLHSTVGSQNNHVQQNRHVSHDSHVPSSRAAFHVRKRILDMQRRHQALPVQQSHRLPGKIVVHSMDIAQALSRRYPQLKGRVYLSSRAHKMNKYANMNHRYRTRHQW